MRGRLIAWAGGAAAILALVALGAYFGVVGLDKASKLAEVIGVFVALVGGGVSIYGLTAERRDATAPSLPAPILPEPNIPLSKKQTNIARDNGTIFASLEGNIIYHADPASSSSQHSRGSVPDDLSQDRAHKRQHDE